MSLDDESYHEQNFYLQSLLPFFIDGASIIEPSPFWQYFMIYNKSTLNLVAFATVYEAHHSAERYRAKVSQVLVLPPYQRQGLGHLLYQTLYQHYLVQPKCFQLIVEDAAEEFQRIQDISNCQEYLKVNTPLRVRLEKQPISNVLMKE